MKNKYRIETRIKKGALAVLFSCMFHVSAYAMTSQELFSYWQNTYGSCYRQETPSLQIQRLQKAPIDECFYGIGDPRNFYAPQSCEGGRWKVNGGQVWGMVKAGDSIWFGTRENPMCITMGMSGVRTPLLTDFEVCEFGESFIVPPLPESVGDWRPPFIYEYDVKQNRSYLRAFLMPGTLEGLPIIHGVRGAAQSNGVVLMAAVAGVDSTSMSVVLFAFNSESGQLLGWKILQDGNGIPYSNTRNWLSYKGQIYGGLWMSNGGRILRWLGDPNAIKKGDLSTLWRFEEVGVLDQQPSNIIVYKGNRLVVGTRQVDTNQLLRGGEIWMSPPFDEYLSAKDAGQWKVVWSVAQYDPDLVSTATTAIGALAYFDGYLWWGTETEIGNAWEVHKQLYGKIIPGYPNSEQALAALYGTWRPFSLFRAMNIESSPKQVDLVYGFGYLPRFSYNATTKQAVWELVPNRMGRNALKGLGGFCNWYQVQAYSMAIFNGKLFVGTNEYSHRIATGGMQLPEFPLPQIPDPSLWGAELWRFDGADSYAIAESLSGMGNYLNTAVRNMIADDALYIGTGNTNNLATVAGERLQGGWELLRLNALPQ